MGMSEKHRKRRQKYLGASEIASVLGVNNYQNAYDLWLEKTGQVAGFEGNEATDAGNRLERALLDWAAEQLNVKVRANQWRVHDNKIHAATLDAEVLGKPEALEAKVSGLFRPGGAHEEWGEGREDVPDRVMVQAQQQAFVANLERVWIPALLGGRGFVMYQIERNEKLIDIIRERGEAFWNDHVLTRVPPEDVTPSVETLKRLRREPETLVQIPDEVMDAYLHAKACAKEAKQAEEQAKAVLIEALGTAEAGECSRGRVTFLEQSRTSIDSKKLRTEYPEIYHELAKETSFRVLRDKLAKGGN